MPPNSLPDLPFTSGTALFMKKEGQDRHYWKSQPGLEPIIRGLASSRIF